MTVRHWRIAVENIRGIKAAVIPALPDERTAGMLPAAPESGRAALLKSFGRRQAYESPGRPNPRVTSGGLWGFRVWTGRDADGAGGY